MTRKQTEATLRDATERYREVLALLVTVVRRQGSLYVEREALADVHLTEWSVHTDATPDGRGFCISAIRKGQAVEPQAESDAVN
jgi:hypothetical protein